MASVTAGTPPHPDPDRGEGDASRASRAAPAPRASRRPFGAQVLPSLGIRAQLVLALTVLLALPWLGWQYLNEIGRFLRVAQDKSLAATAQAIATALNDRPRLFDAPPDPIASFAEERNADEGGAALPPSASPEIEQIIRGLSRIDARIWVVGRDFTVLAHSGSLRREPPAEAPPSTPLGTVWHAVEGATLEPLYRLILDQPNENFSDEAAAKGPPRGRDIEGALAGILTVDHRTTLDGKAVVVAAASPVWLGDRVEGAVVVEQTTNRVLAERNLAFERLFDIVLALVLLGTVALTLFASRLSSRIRRLRDAAEAAIDANGRVRGAFAGSRDGDEIGDLSRAFASALARLAEFADYQEQMAGRLSHELRTPIAVVRSSLENLQQQPQAADARVYIDRAKEGLARLSAILTRMTEAARLEQALADAPHERYDATPVIAACVDGYRIAYPDVPFELVNPDAPLVVDGAPDLLAQMLDKLTSNAVEFRTSGPVVVRVTPGPEGAWIDVANTGPRLPPGMGARLFDSMVSIRAQDGGAHLGLGLFVARMIARYHGGSIEAADRADGEGVIVSVRLPLARA
ncbi:MAG: hypothetical protein JSS46_00040 [Proteobacteria bacterium]|jgi:dedicated sortase system histidine kinase|nr:hypothetical protein [Pseudomonadota bacterium]